MVEVGKDLWMSSGPISPPRQGHFEMVAQEKIVTFFSICVSDQGLRSYFADCVFQEKLFRNRWRERRKKVTTTKVKKTVWRYVQIILENNEKTKYQNCIKHETVIAMTWLRTVSLLPITENKWNTARCAMALIQMVIVWEGRDTAFKNTVHKVLPPKSLPQKFCHFQQMIKN